MRARLLEREAELLALQQAVDRAAAGHGSAMLVFGEAGIGKTSLLRSFLSTVEDRVRVLLGACDDLLTPRTLGPLRDAVRSDAGPLAQAIASGDAEAVYSGVLAELSTALRPTVLVVEDVHWADDRTLDVLRYTARRMGDLPAVLVLSYRDDELGREHPLQRMLGALGGEVRRLPLKRLSRDAVGQLAQRSAVRSDELFRLTGGNPFYVSEAIAAPEERVPGTVVDAVLCRVRQLDEATQRALEVLAVVPAQVDLPLARALLGDLSRLADAEALGVLEVRPQAVAFRHELARRAVESSMAASRRLELNAHVLTALLDAENGGPGGSPDRARVLHFAVEAGDDAAVVAHGPAAAAEATRVGAHRQAAAYYLQVLAREQLLSTEQRAELRHDYAWALYNLRELHAAAEAAAEAVRLREAVAAPGPLADALGTLSRQQWLTLQPAAARRSAERALRLVQDSGDTREHALALLSLGSMLVLTDREHEGLPLLDRAVELAERIGAVDVAALGHNYRGSAKLQLGELSGLDALRLSVEIAREAGEHELVMRGFYNLVEGLFRLGRYAAADEYIDAAQAYARDRDFDSYSYFLLARQLRLQAMHGQWAQAYAEFKAMLDNSAEPAMLDRETLPPLARLAVRMGHADAGDLLVRAAAAAELGDNLEWLVPTGLAHLEHAWLTGRPRAAGRFGALLLTRTDRAGAELARGELLRYLRRLGEPVPHFPACPEPFAAGLRGDWREAAAAWERLGDPYQRALELAESGQRGPTMEALEVFDELGARPAAALVRRRLRELGVRQVPRGPQPSTRANPVGLTARQSEILGLIAAGMTNAEIAERLVVSVRTVDHHVSAVLAKLQVQTRGEAASAFAALGGRGA